MVGAFHIWRGGTDILAGATIGMAVGSIDVGPGNQSGTLNVPGLADGSPIPPVLVSGDALGEPNVSISGTLVSWAPRAGFTGIWSGTILLIVVGG